MNSFKCREQISDNLDHNILQLYNVLIQIWLTTSKTNFASNIFFRNVVCMSEIFVLLVWNICFINKVLMCSYWLYFLIIFFLNFKLLEHINHSQYTISPLHCRLMRWVLFDIKFLYAFIIFLTRTYHLIIFLPYFIFPFPEITRTYTTTVITLPHALKLIVHCLKSIVVGMIFDI